MLMKKKSTIIFLLILLFVGMFFTYRTYWKSDYMCKNLNDLSLSELEEKQKKAVTPCCKCKINNFIGQAKNGDLCRSCCDDECGY